MALRTQRDIASTATILGKSEGDIRAALGAPAASGDSSAGPRSRGERQGGRPSQKSGSSGSKDYRFGGDFWVVMDSDEQEIRKVRTGVTDLDRVEIVDGLDENDRVLILPSSHLLETQQDLQRFIKRRSRGVPGIG
jgi:hypothetical protein